MKKIMLFVAVITAFSFASCKKDKTCSCTTTESSNQKDTDCLRGPYTAPAAETTETTWKKVKKSNQMVAALCSSDTYTYSTESTYGSTANPCPGGNDYTFTTTRTTTCTLK